jgi:hypothetical protein
MAIRAGQCRWAAGGRHRERERRGLTGGAMLRDRLAAAAEREQIARRAADANRR